MAGFVLAEKSEQSQLFDETGKRIPVTLLKTSSCYLIDIKWPEINNYMAVQLGFGQRKTAKKSIQGQIAKAGVKTPLRFLKEIRLDILSATKVEEEGWLGDLQQAGLKPEQIETIVSSLSKHLGGDRGKNAEAIISGQRFPDSDPILHGYDWINAIVLSVQNALDHESGVKPAPDVDMRTSPFAPTDRRRK